MEPLLATIASLPYELSRLPFWDGLAVVMDALRKATRSEVAEVFLREPVAGDMILAAHSGSFRSAFFQLTRFKPGEGYPGIVAVENKPLFTTDLCLDPRFLRDKVKERGFRSYLCLPLQAGDSSLGSMHLASRDCIDFLKLREPLIWACSALSMAVRLRFYQAEKWLQDSRQQESCFPTANVDDLLRDILYQVCAVSEAGSAIITLYDPVSGCLSYLTGRGSATKKPCIPESAFACPALAHSRIFLRGQESRGDGAPCRPLPWNQSLAICVPLIVKKLPLGVLQLGYEKAPRPPTKDVALIASTALPAANLVAMMWRHTKPVEPLFLSGGNQYPNQSSAGSEASAPLRSLDTYPGHHQKATVAAVVHEETCAPLAVRCFGPFQVFQRGQLLPLHRFTRHKALTLLKILAIKRGTPMPADTLAEYLWPEHDPELTAHRLQVVISSLREVVDHRGTAPRWQFIRYDGNGSYYLDLMSGCYLDIEEYHELLARARQLESAGKEDEALALWRRADELYRGDLLEDEPHAEWCWMEREIARETHLDILRRLAMAMAHHGNPEAAIYYYRKALRLDPLREEIHRQLSYTLLQAGRRDEALRQYLQCRNILQRELGITPTPETETLHKILLN